MTISEKVAYLKGLIDGMGMDTQNDEVGRIVTLMTDILEDVSEDLHDLREEQELLGDVVDAVSEDLNDLEELIYEPEDDDEDEDEEEAYAVICPGCGDEICFDESILGSGEVVCPGCGKKLIFDLSDFDEDDDLDDEDDL